MYFFGHFQVFSSADVGLEHFNIEETGKVVLPPSVLAELSDFSSDSPMLFTISHPVTEIRTHCGVIEFSAEEGSVIAPSWVLDQIGVMSGDIVYVESIWLAVGSYARFKPQSTDFLDISNQKAVLENRLRLFSCLTCGDVIPIHYNNKSYLLKVVSTRPGDAICIVNCDLEVEFEEPVGYVAPQKSIPEPPKPTAGESSEQCPSEPLPFKGSGRRLDGKCINGEQSSAEVTPTPQGIPDFDWNVGTLNFFRDSNTQVEEELRFSQNSGRSS